MAVGAGCRGSCSKTLAMLRFVWIMVAMVMTQMMPVTSKDCSCTTANCTVNGEIALLSALYESGENLEATCTISQLQTDPCQFNAQQIYFKYFNKIYNVTVMNATTGRVSIPGAVVLSANSNTHLYCKLHNYLHQHTDIPMKIDQKVVYIADAPTKPRIKECIVYNWDRMICTWEPAQQDTGIETNTTLYWTVLPHVKELTPCPQVDKNCCIWPSPHESRQRSVFYRDIKYYLIITASNAIGESQTNVTVETKYTVKPNRVQLSVISIEARKILTKWTSPAAKFSYDIIYNINITSEWDNRTLNMSTTEPNVTYKLENLVPYTLYNISVRCIPKYDNTGVGYWSNTTTYQIRTNATEPGDRPSLQAGAFHIHADNTIQVYWQSMARNLMNGPNQRTRLRLFLWNNVTSRFGCENVSMDPEYEVLVDGTDTFSELLQPRNLSLQDYIVCLDQRNTIGYSHNASELVVRKRHTGHPGTRFYAERGKNDLVVKWSAVPKAEGYTVFWCEAHLINIMCDDKKPIHSFTLDASETEYRIPEENKHIRVAMATQYRDEDGVLFSTGMQFAKCIPKQNEAVAPPLNVVYYEDLMKFEVIAPRCEDTGHIANYTISLCVQGHCDRVDWATISAELGQFNISDRRGDLQVGATYLVEVCSNGQSDACITITEELVSGLSSAHKGLLAFSVFIVILLLTAGIYAIFRRCRKICDPDKIQIVVIDDIDMVDDYTVQESSPQDIYTNIHTPNLSTHNSESEDNTCLIPNRITRNGSLHPIGCSSEKEAESEKLLQRQISMTSSLDPYNTVIDISYPHSSRDGSREQHEPQNGPDVRGRPHDLKVICPSPPPEMKSAERLGGGLVEGRCGKAEGAPVAMTGMYVSAPPGAESDKRSSSGASSIMPYSRLIQNSPTAQTLPSGLNQSSPKVRPLNSDLHDTAQSEECEEVLLYEGETDKIGLALSEIMEKHQDECGDALGSGEADTSGRLPSDPGFYEDEPLNAGIRATSQPHTSSPDTGQTKWPSQDSGMSTGGSNGTTGAVTATGTIPELGEKTCQGPCSTDKVSPGPCSSSTGSDSVRPIPVNHPTRIVQPYVDIASVMVK